MRILFVTTELYPLVKAGGLGDVADALPQALARLGHDVVVLLPCYSSSWRKEATRLARVRDNGRLLELPRPDRRYRTWLLETPGFLRRRGRPYTDVKGVPHGDDAPRYNELCRAAAAIAGGLKGIDWRPDVVHCHEWQTGLTPVWMMLERTGVPSVFTIHNLAHQGVFHASVMGQLGLPPWLFHYEALEYYGAMSFIKGGLVFADRLTTVSPTYAEEILTPGQGMGLHGVLQTRRHDLVGILNGLDREAWNPRTDAALPARYDARRLAGKAHARTALARELGLETSEHGRLPLAAFVGRLVPQKGIDLLLADIGRLLALTAGVVVLGQGMPEYHHLLEQAAKRWRGRLSVSFEFDDGLARRIYAGADVLLMPSRFEPCGLAQLIAMRYGTIPVVHGVGGLADTVVDASAANLADGTATGFVFHESTPDALLTAMGRVESLYGAPGAWHDLVRNAMQARFDWSASAKKHLAVYRSAMER